MTDCLTKLLGLRGCTDGAEPYQINEIGYSYEQFEEFMDDSYANVDEFFEALRKNAARKVTSDLVSKMPKSVAAFNGLENRTIGLLPDNRETVSQTGLVGVRVDIHNRMEFLRFRISQIRMFVDFTGDVDLKVYNLLTGQEVATTTVTVEAGIVAAKNIDIEIPSARQDLKLWIGYDSTGRGDAYKIGLDRKGCRGCRGNDSHSAFVLSRMSSLEAPFILSSANQLNHTGGISLDYTIECDMAAYACSLSGYLGMPLAYQTAMLLLEYGAKSGGQFSHQKTTNAENNDERYTQASFHYNKEMMNALSNMKFPVNRCFRCDTVTEIYSRLPG